MQRGGSPAQRTGTPGAFVTPDRIALALLTAILTLLFADVLVGINSLYSRDIVHYHYPTKHLLREIVLGGEFPQWNPWFGAGQPMAANPQHEVFYPPNWLIFLPDYHLGFHLLVVLHFYIAAWAMYWFLRSLRIGPAAAFFGAFSFVLGGTCLSYLNLFPFLFSVSWLPLTCLYTRRFLLEGRRRDFALAAGFFGIQFLIGEPTTIAQTGLLLALYAVSRGWRAISRVALIGLVALLLSAVQMLPAIDHAADSVRARGFPYENVTSWSTPPARFAEFIQPNVFGHQLLNEKRLYWGGSLYPGRGVPFLQSIYSGLAVTVLVLAGILANGRGRNLTVALLGTSALLAMGSHTPLWQLLHHSGLASSIRYPEKFLLLGMFAAIVFAAAVLHDLLDDHLRVRRAAVVVATAMTAVTAIAAVVALLPAYAGLFIRLWEPPGRVLAEMLPVSRSGWFLGAARALLLLVLLRNVAVVRRPVWLALLGMFVFLDLGLLHPELAPRVPSAFYREAPRLVRQLPRDTAPYRLFHLASWQISSAGWYTTPQPDLYWIHRNALYPPMTATWGIRTVVDSDYDRTALQPTEDFTNAVWAISRQRPDWLNAVAAMSNIWYVATFVPGPEAFERAQGNRRILQPVRVMELDPHPRYYFAEAVASANDTTEFVQKVVSGTFPDRTAFIEGDAFAPERGRVLRFSETANTVRIDVAAEGRSFLVMSVTPHKYWKITIDGTPAAAVRTNVGYQGVLLPSAGMHVVEMRYNNPLIGAGAAISLAAFLVLVLLAWKPSATERGS